MTTAAADTLSTAVATGFPPSLAVCRDERDRIAAMIARIPPAAKERQRHIAGLVAIDAVVLSLEAFEASRSVTFTTREGADERETTRTGAPKGSYLANAMKALERYCKIYGLDAASKQRADVKIIVALMSDVRLMFQSYIPAGAREPALAELEATVAARLRSG